MLKTASEIANQVLEKCAEHYQNVIGFDDLERYKTHKARLVEEMGGIVVGFCFLIELEFLNPRKVLEGYDVYSLIKYDSE